MHQGDLSLQRGYSLLELVIYVALFVVLVVVVAVTTVALSNAWGQAKAARDLYRSGADAIERVVREVRFAKGIRAAESIFNTNPGTLSLDTFTDPGSVNPTTVHFSVINSRLMVQQGANPAAPLTPDTVLVDAFTVWELTPTTIASTTRIELTLRAAADTRFERSATFNATAVLRGSYNR